MIVQNRFKIITLLRTIIFKDCHRMIIQILNCNAINTNELISKQNLISGVYLSRVEQIIEKILIAFICAFKWPQLI